ncbi:hypothetical protein [Burkholderia multivorans]|uniref:hypothetical protein n=1 Tax=Burkholderia multivorans TaxID=87883 RepID=UPI0020B39692|nr:hypothetical protein [Burkholderia multivorans]
MLQARREVHLQMRIRHAADDVEIAIGAGRGQQIVENRRSAEEHVDAPLPHCAHDIGRLQRHDRDAGVPVAQFDCKRRSAHHADSRPPKPVVIRSSPVAAQTQKSPVVAQIRFGIGETSPARRRHVDADDEIDIAPACRSDHRRQIVERPRHQAQARNVAKQRPQVVAAEAFEPARRARSLEWHSRIVRHHPDEEFGPVQQRGEWFADRRSGRRDPGQENKQKQERKQMHFPMRRNAHPMTC